MPICNPAAGPPQAQYKSPSTDPNLPRTASPNPATISRTACRGKAQSATARRPITPRAPFRAACTRLARVCSTGFTTRVRLYALLTSAMWEKACGKLPTRRFKRKFRIPRSAGRDRCAARGRPLEQPLRVGNAALQGIDVGEPKAASEEGAFARRQAIVGLLRVITHHEAVAQQTALDSGDGAFHARIGNRQETDARYEQQIGVEMLSSRKTARSCPDLEIESLLAHTSSQISSRNLRHSSIGPSSPKVSALLIARSKPPRPSPWNG